MITAYKLSNDKIGKDIIAYGISNATNSAEEKISNALRRVKPYVHGIPFFDGSEFAFKGLDELNTFLFNYCNFDSDECKLLDQSGWKIEKIKCDSIVKGLSNMILGYFTDSCEHLKDMSLYSLYGSSYKIVQELQYPKDDAMFIYNSFYKKKGIKF